jgi:hypothetical protein
LGTNALMDAPLAAENPMLAAATTTETTMSWPYVNCPNAYVTGTDMITANRTTSIPTITGCLRRTSTHGPNGTATSAPTANPAAASSETCVGELCNTRIAINGNASNASHVPAVLTAYAPHNHSKSLPTRQIQAVGCARFKQRHVVPDNHRLLAELGC